MLDSWLAERLMAFSITINEFPLVANQQVYTYGPSGNFNAPRPVKIERTSIVSLQNPSQPLELPIPYFTDWEWQNTPVKVGFTSTLPQGVYDDGNYPLRNLSIWPIPNTVSNIRLYVWQQLSQFADLVTDYEFPPAYAKAITYNLAVDLAPEYGFPNISPVVAQQALESKGIVKSINIPVIQSYCDAALIGEGGRYNYYSDTVVGGNRN